MRKINLTPLSDHEDIVQPDDMYEININSPALAILTDFKIQRPIVVDADTEISQAEYLMKKAHVRLLLVLDRYGDLIGTISLQELELQHIQALQSRGLKRAEMTVRDLMIPRNQLRVFHYEDLITAQIIDVLDALRQNGKLHCLVVDEEEQKIRGIIAASEIAKRLHIPIEIEKPTTFVDIFKLVNDSYHALTPPEQLSVAGF